MLPIIKAFLKPFISVLKKNISHKWIVHNLKHTSSRLHFYLSAKFGKVREVHTYINSNKTNDQPYRTFHRLERLPMISSSSGENRTLLPQGYEVDTSGIG